MRTAEIAAPSTASRARMARYPVPDEGSSALWGLASWEGYGDSHGIQGVRRKRRL